MFTPLEQKFARSSGGKIALRSQLVAASHWGVGCNNALIIAFAMAPILGLRGEIESDEGLLEFPCSPSLGTNKANIPVFVGAHYKHGRVQAQG